MKNSLFRKILAVGATLALVSSFFVAVPVSAAPGCNAWGDIDMPDFAPYTEPGVMAVTPDGSLMFIALYYETEYGGDKANTWEILYSEDGGFNWKDTKLNNGYLNDKVTNFFDEGDRGSPVKILVSPMWPNNKNVYVAFNNGDVWRLPDAGKGTPAMLNPIFSNKGTYLDEMTYEGEPDGGSLWDMDIWADGTYNYLAVATDLDVFVIKDQLLNDWKDYDLNTTDDNVVEGNRRAAAVRFAPDFATSELLWAVATKAGGETPDETLVLTSADSPSKWAYVFVERNFVNYNDDPLEWGWVPFVDIEFDAAYTAANPQMYVGIAPAKDLFYEKYNVSARDQATGNIFRVNANAIVGSKGTVEIDWMYFGNRAFGSIEVSGDTIMALDYATGEVLTTTNAGATWTVATRNPAAPFLGELLMAPDFAQSGTVYAAVKDFNWYLADDDLKDYFGEGISGLYRSTDGGVFFDGISLLDMTIERIVDLAFDPKGGSQPVLMVLRAGGDKGDFIFYTADATVESPRWLMKDGLAAYETEATELASIDMISWDEAGNTVMFIGRVVPKGGTVGTYYIYRSTDEGNSFRRWRDLPTGQIQAPVDWYVVDASTVSIVGANGYWGVKPFGTPVTRTDDFVTGLNSIARQGDKIAVGTVDGDVYVSTDAGNTWSVAVSVVTGTTANTFVAFGPNGVLYAVAGNGTTGTVASISVGADTPAPSVEAVQNGRLNLTNASGIWVSPDNTLYVMATPSASTLGNEIAAEGTITLGGPELTTAPTYVLSNAADAAKITLSPIVVTGDKPFEAEEELDVVAADVKAISSSMASGYIIVKGKNSGAVGYVNIEVKDFANPFSMFGAWPADISVGFAGVKVAKGPSVAGTALFRLLLGEDDNVWEEKGRANAVGLWGTTGSNLAWTVVNNTSIWALEDFNSGKVQNVTVKEVKKDATKAAKTLEVSWTALNCTSLYEIYVDGVFYYWYNQPNATAGTTLSVEIPNMNYNTTYDVQVRAADSWNSYGSATPALRGSLQSRLSAVAKVTTECYNVAPNPQVPVQGMQDASLAPSFVWAAPTAGCAPVSYDFQLSTDPNFGSFIIDTTVTGTGYTYTARDLAYDTNHYWRVRSVAADGTKSDWTTVQNFHTMMEPAEVVPPVTITTNPPQTVVVTVPPPQTFTIPAPQTITVPPQVTLTQTVTSVAGPTISLPDQPTPAYIWVIVAVGAVLTIAVIVLIVRTRRAE